MALRIFVMSLLFGGAFGSAQSTVPNSVIQDRLSQLLTGYGVYKGYPNTAHQAVEATLFPDRRRVFHAIVRALFTEISPGAGSADRVIDHLEQVRGIWGRRDGDPNGRHQFRLSVVWRDSLPSHLAASPNFPRSRFGHVLMPVPQGGDDDPGFSGFDVRSGGAVETFRQRTQPGLQLSYLKNNPTVGEVDLDFDSGFAHHKPSNSDPGSRGRHSHLEEFNASYGRMFGRQLRFNYLDELNHGNGSYSDAYYR